MMAKRIYDDELMGKAFDPRLARKAFAFVKPHKAHLALAMVTVLATSGIGLIEPKLWKMAIDQGIAKRDMDVVTRVALMYLCVFAVRWVFQAAQTIIVQRLGQSVLHDIRHTVFSHLQNLSLGFFDKREIGRIIARLTSDVDAVNDLLTSSTLSIVSDVGMIVGIVVILVRENLQLALITLSLVPVMVIVTSLFRAKARLAYRDVRRKVATVTATVAENVSGVRVVKSFSREGENLRRFKQINQDNRQAVLYAARIQAVFGPLITVLTMCGICAVYWYGGLRVIAGALTIGILVEFAGYMDRFYAPIRDMSNLYQTMQGAMAGAERIFEILDTEQEIKDAPGAVDLPQIDGHVEFRNVDFSYGDTPILRGIGFDAKAGDTIALVGPTGAGKTTIINLLARQYDIKSGMILIDGHDVREVTMRSLRQQMGVVLQDAFLFPGSIKENIRYGRLDATDQEVESAACTVGLHDFIAELPDRYDTDVREGGSKLSSGQKQLVSFARALLADPRILILDEATSSVDTQTEVVIQEALRKLLKGRTSFVIAHRLSTISEADKILVVDGGEIVESGRHLELMGHDGLYKKLHDMQFNYGIEEEEAALENG
jgi:ATP-binding cassette, subfamily B, multidrug efflux pump